MPASPLLRAVTLGPGAQARKKPAALGRPGVGFGLYPGGPWTTFGPSCIGIPPIPIGILRRTQNNDSGSEVGQRWARRVVRSKLVYSARGAVVCASVKASIASE